MDLDGDWSFGFEGLRGGVLKRVVLSVFLYRDLDRGGELKGISMYRCYSRKGGFPSTYKRRLEKGFSSNTLLVVWVFGASCCLDIETV